MANEEEQRAQWVALSLSPHIGAKTFANLLERFQGDFSAIFDAPESQLRGVPGIGPKIASDIKRVNPSRITRSLRAWEGQGVRVLLEGDPEYPCRLRDVADKPPTLFALGNGWRQEPCIAIVGTRYPSQVAKVLTLQLAMKLARAGCAIVSGLALGIDAAAHASALEAGGVTIAVLGSGVLNIYPRGNRHIAQRIVGRGALISETHPQQAPNAQRLVARNRIISGLASAVIMIESELDGGAMHTVRFAREQGRRVFTFRLPASGNDQLMRTGAAVLPSDLDRALKYLLG